MQQNDITPKNDATLGLIFRLNALWARVDLHAEAGSYDSWNNVLDSLYRNLLYREDMVIKEDNNGEIIKIGLSDKDEKQYKFLCGRISKLRLLSKTVKGNNKKGIPKWKVARSYLYKAVAKKDIWVRKLMNELNLYIKETTKTPGTAMFGR